MGVYFVGLSYTTSQPPPKSVDWVELSAQFHTPLPGGEGVLLDLEASYADAYGGGGGGGYNALTLNKAWQTTGTPQWVYWRTTDPDSAGASFPGPGVFGTTTNYAVETIAYVSV